MSDEERRTWQKQYEMSAFDRCRDGVHRWSTYVGEPVPLSMFEGLHCYCGGRVLILHRCTCGHEHLSES